MTRKESITGETDVIVASHARAAAILTVAVRRGFTARRIAGEGGTYAASEGFSDERRVPHGHTAIKLSWDMQDFPEGAPRSIYEEADTLLKDS